MGTIIEIERTGVVHVQIGYETWLRVDSDDLLAELVEALDNTPHNSDYEGRFAARIKIEVEFLSEFREKESGDG